MRRVPALRGSGPSSSVRVPMPACLQLRGPAAGKNSFIRPVTTFNGMGFKERNREIRNIFESADVRRPDTQMGDVFPIDRIFIRLIPEYLQSNIRKLLIV